MEFNPDPDDETYYRLNKLVDELDTIICQHIIGHDEKTGLSDAFNAVCAVLSGVVQSVSDIDRDVFQKLSGAIAYHIYCQARGISERGEYKIQ